MINTYVNKIYSYSNRYSDIGSENNCIFVAGSGRSGTTWLASILSEIYAYRILFEPFYSLHIQVDGINDFFHHRFIDNGESKYNKDIEFVLKGKYKMKYRNPLFRTYKGRIVKDICANLFLHIIHEIMPRLPIIFIVRHPCSVVLSRLKKREWSSEWGLHADIFNNQKLLIDKFFNGRIYKPQNELEDHIITYCFENFYPLKVLKGCDYIYQIYYESLLLDFENQMTKLVDYIEAFSNQRAKVKSIKSILGTTSLANPNNLELILQKPIEHVEQWKKSLKGKDIQKILNILDDFELGFVDKDISSYAESFK